MAAMAAAATTTTAAPFRWSLAALETLMAEDQMAQHGAVLRAFSVVELWRLRRVCRAFHRWGTAALAALPRVAAVGGSDTNYSSTANVEVLDLSTLRWSSGAVPALPQPRKWHSACSFGGGRLVVAGGTSDLRDSADRIAVQWVPGATEWTTLPEMAEARHSAVAVALPDGRVVAIGGHGGHNIDNLASAEVLAADGSGWSALAPIVTKRHGHAAAALPCGKVLVVGGQTQDFDDDFEDDLYDEEIDIKTAELWGPATGAWSALPPMAHHRYLAGACVLPRGRVAVVGGQASAVAHTHGELFDLQARTWQPLPPMAHERGEPAVVAVAGGMLAVGGLSKEDPQPDELFDEASGRWFELPHPMAERRRSTQ
eukprot:COSAG04_NODE_1894_length_5288_cov_2.767200_1_plen_369_part_10